MVHRSDQVLPRRELRERVVRRERADPVVRERPRSHRASGPQEAVGSQALHERSVGRRRRVEPLPRDPRPPRERERQCLGGEQDRNEPDGRGVAPQPESRGRQDGPGGRGRSGDRKQRLPGHVGRPPGLLGDQPQPPQPQEGHRRGPTQTATARIVARRPSSTD